MLFHVLTLKSNTWKFIGQVKYEMKFEGRIGILCGGALHWMMTLSNNKKKEVIISLDLSTEEFKEIPLPDALTDQLTDCVHHDNTLCVIEEFLCVYSRCEFSHCSPLSTKKWVMKNKWELYIDGQSQSKYDVAHLLTHTGSDVYMCDDGTRVPCNGDYIRAGIFVKSLVSPHPQFHVK